MNIQKCISTDQIEIFLAGEADAEAAVRIESHLSRCNACAQKIESLKKITAAWDGWTAAGLGEAWRRTDEDARAASGDAVVEILGNAGREARDSLTELEKKRIEKWDREYVPAAADRDADFSMDHDGEDFMLLAASPKADRELNGHFGEALGVAVDEKTGKGALIRVSARVGDDIKKEGSVKIVGSQVEGRSRNGFGYRTTPPLQLLGERLRERFKAPAIAPLALHKRDVYIEIENMDYLTRSRSLMLSVIAAVIKASVKETGFEDLVYSADVDLDGRVQGVGRIADKAEFVLSEGSLRFASASDDLHGIPAHLRESHAEDMVSFHDLSDLLKYLHVRLTAAKTDVAAARAPRSGTKIFGPVRTPILLLALIASGLMAFLGFITGNYYATADLMTLFHLKSGHGGLIGWARIINPALWIFLIAWLSVRCIHIFTAFISRGGKTPFLPGLSRVKRYPVVQIVVLLSLIYFGFNLHIFVETSPDNFKSYERIEYLIHDKTFRDVARDVPNHRYMEFEKLAAGRGADELEKGLTIGLGIRPSDPVFKKAFVRMTGMLMDSVNNVVYARRLLESYIQFTDSIRDNPNAKQWAADTIDAAEDLMNRYKLKETFYGEKRFGSLIGEVVSRYGL